MTKPLSSACFVEKNGIQITCECITNSTCVEVTRHGIAVLFDITRGNGEKAMKAKAIAFQEGLHELLLDSLDAYPEDAEICMMSQQMLGGATTLKSSNLVVERKHHKASWKLRLSRDIATESSSTNITT